MTTGSTFWFWSGELEQQHRATPAPAAPGPAFSNSSLRLWQKRTEYEMQTYISLVESELVQWHAVIANLSKLHRFGVLQIVTERSVASIYLYSIGTLSNHLVDCHGAELQAYLFQNWTLRRLPGKFNPCQSKIFLKEKCLATCVPCCSVIQDF